MTDEDLRQAINKLVDEVRDVHGTVERIAKRQEAGEGRIEELHRDHLQLKERVQSVSSEIRLIEQATQLHRKSDDGVHLALTNSISILSDKLDKITGGLFFSALTIVLGLGVLLYQTLVSGVQT